MKDKIFEYLVASGEINNNDELEKKLRNSNLEEWEKDLVRSGQYNIEDFEDDNDGEEEDDDYYEE